MLALILLFAFSFANNSLHSPDILAYFNWNASYIYESVGVETWKQTYPNSTKPEEIRITLLVNPITQFVVFNTSNHGVQIVSSNGFYFITPDGKTCLNNTNYNYSLYSK